MRQKFISYIRVSTRKQERSGLGLEAQQSAVKRFVNGREADLIAEFREAETGTRNDRPQLQKALALCRKAGATLVIARIDRLSRCAPFLLSLRDAGIEFTCCDMPNADRLTIGVLALLAEREAELISERTRAALLAAKKRGTRLGNPNPLPSLARAWQRRQEACHAFSLSMAPILQELRSTGLTSPAAIAEALTRRGYRTAMNKEFTMHTVANLIKGINRAQCQ